MKGLGGNAAFTSFHPMVNILYFALATGITMFSMSAYFLAVTCVVACFYSILLGGSETLKFNLSFLIFIVFFCVIFNMFCGYYGKTVIFYFYTHAITYEAMVFGLASGTLLASAAIWFSCFNIIMTSEKLIYLFGRIAPIVGLTLALTFRFIPLLRARFAEISMGQKCLGHPHLRRVRFAGRIAHGRQLAKEIAILTAWSLEAFIECGFYGSTRLWAKRQNRVFSVPIYQT